MAINDGYVAYNSQISNSLVTSTIVGQTSRRHYSYQGQRHCHDIKEVRKLDEWDELKVMQHLTPDLHNVDPSNHCAPALDYFSDEREAMYDFIVMPIYRKFDNPSFYSIGKVIDFVHQTLEVRPVLVRREHILLQLGYSRAYNICTTET